MGTHSVKTIRNKDVSEFLKPSKQEAYLNDDFRIQFLPRIHFTKTNRLTLFREITAVYS
jgi:hypothetical protein